MRKQRGRGIKDKGTKIVSQFTPTSAPCETNQKRNNASKRLCNRTPPDTATAMSNEMAARAAEAQGYNAQGPWWETTNRKA